jgi:DNA-binding GntR family transcriptional regulator
MKVSRQRLSNQVYDILKEMIADYRFAPGTRINVEQVAKEVGASRTPVWEAVHRLIQEGLLENIPNRGVFMVSLTPKMAIELYQVRQVLEALAASLAIQNVTDRVIRRMAKILEEQRKTVEQEDLVGYSRLDYEFHALVYETSGNRTLQELLGTIKNKMRPLAMQVNKILSRLYEDHMEILGAFQERDAGRAEAGFRRHNLEMIELIRSASKNDQWKEVQQEKGDGKTVKKATSSSAGKSARKK